ncbi:hypothetical protein GIB67_013722 [Kingdonia uniflora]|uniref:Uncharacterized protein n=1 Tax=Kingdonia uniflora TaxID=39325 RepID=A0A7J7NQQ0_9MAGN|nr:hypothetical protein GIB67_013722 [Kingdonia uniflora]
MLNSYCFKSFIANYFQGVTTTIAGGFSGKTGNVDGPAQNASFSEDFELAFVPDVCALLITDRGNRLVRQMKLKAQDCASASPFRKAGSHGCTFWRICKLSPRLGLWIGSSISSLLCEFYLLVSSDKCFKITLILEILAPCQTQLCRQDVTRNHRFSETWKHCQINLMTQIPIIFSDIRNEVASSAIYSVADKLFRMSLSHLSLIFRIGSVEQISSFKRPVSLLNPDCLAKDLISFDEDIVATEMVNKTLEQGDEYQANEGLACNKGRLDSMMHANMLDFAEKFREKKTLEGSLGLIKRK